MKNQTIQKIGGVFVLVASLLATQAFAICSGATLNGIQNIQGCANYEGCGVYAKLPPIVQYTGCACWCCPGSATVYFNPASCDSGPTTPTNSIGEPYCCQSLDQQGLLYAQVACPVAAGS